MSDVAFRTATTLRKGVSPPYSPKRVIERFDQKFSVSPAVVGPFRVKHPDGKVGQPVSRKEVGLRLGAVLPHQEAGARLAVFSDNGQAFRIHAVATAIKPATDVHGVPYVRQWAGIVEATWPKARFAGSCVCKDDSGSNCNGHNDCAAIDYFDTWRHMDQMVRKAVSEADERGVSYVILRDRIWVFGPPRTNSSRGWYPYTGIYHSHVHVSFIGGICGIACKPSSEWP